MKFFDTFFGSYFGAVLGVGMAIVLTAAAGLSLYFVVWIVLDILKKKPNKKKSV